MKPTTTFFLLTLALLGWSAPGAAQYYLTPRSQDYLFGSTAADSRALWVNPAGLGVIPEASIFGEFTVERPEFGDSRLQQYGFGLNSRGIALGLYHNRLPSDTSYTILKVGAAAPFPRGAVGVSASWYRLDGPDSRDIDIGVMYLLNPMIALGATVEHLGRGEIYSQKLPITFSGSGRIVLGGILSLAGEARAVERLGASSSGVDTDFRFGADLGVPLEVPFHLMGVVDLDGDFTPRRLHLGLSVGGPRRVAAIGTLVDGTVSDRLDQLSLTGVAADLLVGR